MEINALKRTNLKDIMPKNAGAHNSVFRGEDISKLYFDGTLSKQIAAETFDDIFVGDYIIGQKSGKKYYVAGLNYMLGFGFDTNNKCETPHILMIPSSGLAYEKMNTTESTAGGYVGSNVYKTVLPSIKNKVTDDLWSSHLLIHKEVLCNAVTNGKETGYIVRDSAVELLSERMVYGTNIFKHEELIDSYGYYKTHVADCAQLPIFQLRKDYMVMGIGYSLRDVSSDKAFCQVSTFGGSAGALTANTANDILPYFLIY